MWRRGITLVRALGHPGRGARASLAAAACAVLLAGCGDATSRPMPATLPPVVAAAPPAATAPSQSPSEPAAGPAFPLHAAGSAVEEAPPAETFAEQRAPAEEVQPVFRPSDRRPRHDDEWLARHGIHRYESKRLRLYTDLAPQLARPLPPLIDLAYAAWEEYLGPLPPDREGTDFQITGYLLDDRPLFERVGLIPADLPAFVNGRHRGAEFWMINPQEDYYRRHLLIHEATHCYMTIMPGTRAPVWYLEGVAEQFGTHRIAEDGRVHFRVMPDDREHFGGLGRIRMIAEAVAAGKPLSLDDVSRLQPNDYLKTQAYAWSWALCEFLGKHPRYRDRFRELSRHVTGTQFEAAFGEFFDRDLPDIRTEWPLFVRHLQHGYDHERAAIDFQPGKPLDAGAAASTCEVAADRGWQSSGYRVEAGRSYEVSASGQFVLATEPKPWVSEPQGVSIRYWDGRPLGMLLAAIRSDEPSDGTFRERMLETIPIGRQARFAAPVGGTLYFRVNDSWSELADNSGRVQVQLRLVP